MREGILTVAIFAFLLFLALTSWAGVIAATMWISCGIYMVLKTRSRGLLADISFLATWPLYVALGR